MAHGPHLPWAARALAAVAVKFVEELVVTIPLLLSMKEREFVMFVLGLIDLALIGNLALMAAFVGYENFVSKLQTGDSEDRPAWMGHVDFSGLNLNCSARLSRSRQSTCCELSWTLAIADLMAVRRELDSIIGQCGCGAIANCPIIEALSPINTYPSPPGTG
jgi:hypothetical protein